MTDVSHILERGPQLRGVLVAASDEAVVQLVVARHARSRLSAEEIRDVKLSTLLIDTDAGPLSGKLRVGNGSFIYDDASCARLASLGGLSRDRFVAAVARLLEAGVLVVSAASDSGFVFAERVLRAAGAAEYLDWQSVTARLEGRAPALLVLRSVLDAMRAPWDWTSLTYEVLAEHSCYSLGMARHGIAQLVAAGVLDRSTHAGRGHGYRCSAWALGRVRDVPLAPTARANSVQTSSSAASQLPAAASVSGRSLIGDASETVAGDSELTVEIGGLVLRLPVGTEIRMRIEANGLASYEVGPHLRLKPQSSGE